MCGRFASQLPPELVVHLFATANSSPNPKPPWHLAPTQPAMLVRRYPGSGPWYLDLRPWGLVPSFTEDLKALQAAYQRTSETAAAASICKSAMASRQAIAVVDALMNGGPSSTARSLTP